MPVRLEALTLAHLDALQEVVIRSTDYYELVEGQPPGPTEARTIYEAMPEDAKRDDPKLLLALLDDDGSMIGVADLIRDWPIHGSWIIGLLLLVPDSRGAGIGSEALSLIESRAALEGADSTRVAVYRANPRAVAFWQAHGYQPAADDDRDPLPMVKRLAA